MSGAAQLEALLKWMDYHVLLRMCSLLPQRLAYTGGRFRARYRHRIRRDTRAAARKHMRDFLPGLSESLLNRYVREFFYSPCLDELEGYFLPGLTASKLSKLVTVEGRENLDRCLDRGRGAVVFSTHSAGVALCLVTLGLLGYKNNVVGRSLDEEDNHLHPVFRAYAQRRVRCIERILDRQFLEPGRGNSAVLASRLRDNELVFTLLDVPPEIVRQKVIVRFMERDCLFPSGFARLARETGCGLVPIEKFYQPGWHHQKLLFGKPIYASENIKDVVQTCVSIVEEMIYRNPSQWYVWDNLPMFWATDPESNGNPE